MYEHYRLLGALPPEGLSENLEEARLRAYGRRELRYRWTAGVRCYRNGGRGQSNTAWYPLEAL